MIVVMSPNSSQMELDEVQKRIENRGLKAQISKGVERTVVGVLGTIPPDFKDEMEMVPWKSGSP
jgi:3-deoxy-7-phosphoheptulonate synthase